MFDLLTYNRNYLALKTLGISYTSAHHNAYKQKLSLCFLEPISLKKALDLYGCNDLGNIIDDQDQIADLELHLNSPIIEDYLTCLSDAVEKPLHLTSTKYFANSIQKYGVAMGVTVDGKRQWSLSLESITSPDQPAYHFFDMDAGPQGPRHIADTGLPIHHHFKPKMTALFI